MKTETMYATMPPWRLFFKIALPGMISMFAMDNYLRISGFVKTSMLINIFCNLLTISLLAFFLLVRIGREIKGREKTVEDFKTAALGVLEAKRK